MPVAWEDFEAVDQPKTEAVDWNEFEPVPQEVPDVLKGVPRNALELAAKNFAVRQQAKYLPPEGVGRGEVGALEPFVPIPRVESTDPRFKKAVKMVMDPFGDTEPSQTDLEGIAAVLNTGKGVLETAQSPLGIATAGVGALGGIAAKLASLGWGLFGASQIPNSIEAYKQAKTGQEKLEAGLGVGLNLALPVGAATHIYPPFVKPTLPEVLARQIGKAPLEVPPGLQRPVEPLVERVAPRPPAEPTPEPISTITTSLEAETKVPEKVRQEPLSPEAQAEEQARLAAELVEPELTDEQLWQKAQRKEKLTPEESERLDKIESRGDEMGEAETTALQAEANALKAPPAPAIPEGGISPAKVQVGGEELKSLRKANVKADPRLDMPGITRKVKPNSLVIQLRDLDSNPIKDIVVESSGDPVVDSQTAGRILRENQKLLGRASLRESLAVSTGPNGRAIYKFDTHPNGMTWAKAQDWIDLVESRNKPQPAVVEEPKQIGPPTLTPAESTRLKSLTEKMESGKPLTSAEQKRYRALKDKVSPPEGEKPGVKAGSEPVTELPASASIAQKEEAYGGLVRDKILNAPSFPKLLAAAKSFQKSIHGALRADWEEAALQQPWDLLSEHAGVMNAKSARAKTLRSLADAVIKESGVPMQKPGTYRGMDYRIDWDKVRPPTTPPSTGEGMRGGELQMAIVPGLKEFVEQDLVPFAKKVGQTIGETAQQMKAMAAPPTMGPEASLAAGIVREHKGKLAQTDVQMREKFHKNLKDFDGMSPQASLAFIDRMERGGVQPSTPLHQLQSELRTEFDRRVAQVRALGTGKLQHLIQDYFPHIWKDPNAAVSWYARILGKRPLKGPASFLKRRTIPLTVDGVQAGLEPVSWNPVELSLLKFHEMDRYVMGQRIFQEFKDKGLAQFSRSDIPPTGFARIDDRVANVIEYRPTTKASGAPGAPERILRGHWFVQEDAARVLNNFLSPGLDRYKWFRAIRWIGNTMNMAQLGLSGYHFTFTMIDSGTSKLSLGMEQLAKGELKAGGAKSAQGLVPAVNQLEYYIRGNKVLQEYTKPGSVGNEYAKIVDALIASGGRVEMPRIFRNNSLENFFKAARTGNYPGAIVRAPFAAIEAVSYPLMQNIVPRLKLGVFSDMALAEIEKMGPNVARDEYRARLGKIWDSVDNRMGEMVYDNLFWNRNLKDLSFLAVRAVGWNLGTIRELGGGVMDAATVVSRVRRGDPLVTRRMAYVVALPVTVGIMGAMYQYAKTGQGPQELRDYFYPKTGKMLPDGTPERVNFPSYLKDIASYGMHPFKTLTNKLHPLWSEMAQMFDNKDYYGQQIRNPDDPLVKQVKEELAFVAKNFVPFSVRGAERRAGAKESKEIKAESFFGVMPISPEIARTPAQNKIMEYSRAKAPVGGRTPEEQQRSEFTRDIESQLQGPQDYAKTQQALIQAQREGKITRSQRLYQLNKLRFERLEMGRGHSKAQAQWLWRFEHLPVDQAQHVYDISTPVEKQLFKRALDLKVRRARQPQPTE